ncbi:MAG TPA: hypothetical protein VI913_01825 [Candidatus Peribacteraceae bacterium]|nr:hypothetical protein [Candidatus Peribacteraceae bacterium]
MENRELIRRLSDVRNPAELAAWTESLESARPYQGVVVIGQDVADLKQTYYQILTGSTFVLRKNADGVAVRCAKNPPRNPPGNR